MSIFVVIKIDHERREFFEWQRSTVVCELEIFGCPCFFQYEIRVT